VAVFEISAGSIQSIVGRHEGLGRSGQTMLVDREGGELVMRSTWAGQAHMGDTITSWAPGFVAAAADGDHGRLVHTDEGGHTRIAVYQPIDVFDDQWAIISTMDLAEAIDPHLEGAERDFLTQYIEQYGFGDLLLITPEGQIFYSAAKHGDHGANLRSGPLRDTNLGDLFERVVESGEFRFADLAAYPPHNHRPAAFMAQPVTSSRGIEVVVAVALSHEDFNAIMHQRSGLGQTGQAYLVGPDKLMRSDAQSSSKRHSVLASFANPGKGRMDTAAVREALSGDSGARRIENAAGQAVMAAYAPVNLADRTWALVADLKMEEALAAIDRLKSTLTLAAGGLVIVILIAAWLLARSLANPLRRSVRTLKDMDQGDFRNRLDVRSGDEVGELAGKFNSVLEALGAIIGRLRDNVAQLGRASGEMDTVSEDMADGAREMSARTEELGDSSKEVRGLMDGIARATDELSGNVKATADAVEEMSESMLQVSQNAGASASAAQAAAASAEATSDLVAQLRSSAQEVGQVVDLIGEVAFQTNMLAINASLEAARAGSSGKGFSVVAAEVKRLAGQTAESTDVIRLKIEAMQNNTAQVSQAMTDIVDRIQTATRQAERIAAAMDEQTKTARNISSNVAQAADRADDVSSNTAQAAQVSSSMMQNIDQVANAARLTSDGSERVRRSSVTLYDLTAQMQELITKFQV
jgi:methyl-accepting chemotaxis protein